MADAARVESAKPEQNHDGDEDAHQPRRAYPTNPGAPVRAQRMEQHIGVPRIPDSAALYPGYAGWLIGIDAEDQTLSHALKAIPEKGFKVLRVIYNETTEPVTIITAYFE